MTSGIRELYRLAVDLLYPRRCVGCGAFETFLCDVCESSMVPTTTGDRCPNCSARWEGGLNCPRCFSSDALDAMAGAFDMEGVARQLVHAIKYRGLRDLAPLLAEPMQSLRERSPFDVAVAVPLHRSRERHRGFNQAADILRHTGWPIAEGRLVRLRKTDTQVGMKPGERRANISDAFTWRGPPLSGLTVAVVDDVITTGATANECARVLRENGARRVVALAFARANYEPSADAPIND